MGFDLFGIVVSSLLVVGQLAPLSTFGTHDHKVEKCSLVPIEKLGGRLYLEKNPKQYSSFVLVGTGEEGPVAVFGYGNHAGDFELPSNHPPLHLYKCHGELVGAVLVLSELSKDRDGSSYSVGDVIGQLPVIHRPGGRKQQPDHADGTTITNSLPSAEVIYGELTDEQHNKYHENALAAGRGVVFELSDEELYKLNGDVSFVLRHEHQIATLTDLLGPRIAELLKLGKEVVEEIKNGAWPQYSIASQPDFIMAHEHTTDACQIVTANKLSGFLKEGGWPLHHSYFVLVGNGPQGPIALFGLVDIGGHPQLPPGHSSVSFYMCHGKVIGEILSLSKLEKKEKNAYVVGEIVGQFPVIFGKRENPHDYPTPHTDDDADSAKVPCADLEHSGCNKRFKKNRQSPYTEKDPLSEDELQELNKIFADALMAKGSAASATHGTSATPPLSPSLIALKEEVLKVAEALNNGV